MAALPNPNFAPNSDMDWTQDVVYVQPPDDWEVQNAFRLNTDEFGVTSLNLEYKLPRTANLPIYLPVKGQRNKQFPTLTVFDSEVNGDGPWWHLRVLFTGFLGTNPPKQIHESKNRQIRDQVVFIQTGQGSATIRYLAPTRTIKYAATKEPAFLNPYFGITDFEDDILIMCLVAPNGIELDNDQFEQIFSLLKFEVRTVRTDLQIDKAGSVIRITEFQERVIYQPGKVAFNIKGIFANQGVPA